MPGSLRAEKLRERLAAEHRLRPLGDDVRAGASLVVAALDQQPLRLGARSRALQREAAAHLLAVQDEDAVAALERLGPRDPAALLIGAAVPHDHTALAERALEVVVGQAVVLDLDGQALGGGIERRPLGHRPGPHDPADLQTQIEMVGGRLVLLDDEDTGADATDRELLVALDAHALTRNRVTDERHERLQRVGRTLGMDLAGRPHPPEAAQLARLGGHDRRVAPPAAPPPPASTPPAAARSARWRGGGGPAPRVAAGRSRSRAPGQPRGQNR